MNKLVLLFGIFFFASAVFASGFDQASEPAMENEGSSEMESLFAEFATASEEQKAEILAKLLKLLGATEELEDSGEYASEESGDLEL